MEHEVKQWLKLAEMDYGVAEHLFQTYLGKKKS